MDAVAVRGPVGERKKMTTSLASHAPTLSALLAEQAQFRGDRLAFRFLPDGEHEARGLTYGELERHARAVAVHLRHQGAPGERALLLLGDGIDFVRAFMGCQRAGIIAVPVAIPMPLGSERKIATLRAVAADSGASMVLTAGPPRQREVIQRAAPELAALPWIDVAGVEPADADGYRPVPVRPDDVSFLQYTSGSTSLPKGVVITHAGLLANEKLLSSCFGTTERDVIVCWMPLFHDAGLIAHVLHATYLGAQAVLLPPLAFAQRPARWLRAISTYHGTVSGGPNFAYDLCVRRIPAAERAGLDLSSWRRAFNGAEPVRAGTLETFAAAFRSHGFEPSAMGPCYGLAECTVFGTGPVPWSGPSVLGVRRQALEEGRFEPGEHRIVASGRAMSHRTVRIVDQLSRRALPEGRVGEVWLAGPDVAQGYWGRPELRSATFAARLAEDDGATYLRTGDLGMLHEGELYITGRIKDLLIVSGRNHYPQDIEHTVEAVHPWIRSNGCAVFGLEAGDHEQVIAVAEVLADDDVAGEQRLSLPALRQAVRAAVTEQHGIDLDDIVFATPGAVPKTSSGKLQRSACRDAYQHGRLRLAREFQAQTGGNA
jgi:acyl-CoA synthetase (AMP-forming)/AMP-acid ligase II